MGLGEGESDSQIISETHCPDTKSGMADFFPRNDILKFSILWLGGQASLEMQGWELR